MRNLELDTKFDSTAQDEFTPKFRVIAHIPLDVMEDPIMGTVEVNGLINLSEGQLQLNAEDSDFNIVADIVNGKFFVDLENDIEYHPYIEGYKITPEVIHCVEDCELQLTADKL